jgi:hypothetical protein
LNLYLKKKKNMEINEVKEEVLEGPLILHIFLFLNTTLELVSSIPGNHHTTLLPCLTWKRKFLETLFHFEKFLILMSYSNFNMSTLLIQSQDLLLQSLLHHDLDFPC